MAMGLGDSEGTISNVPDILDITSFLNQLPYFMEYWAEDQVAMVMLGDADPPLGG